MSNNVPFRRLLLLAALTSLAACSGLRGPDAVPGDSAAATGPTAAPDATAAAATDVPPPVETAPAPAAPSANPAVVALLDSAHADARAERLPRAIAAVERALRIEPRNPHLWQELARLKLQKGDYQQAENFAVRANSWAGSDKGLQAKSWRIIGEARSLRGDNAGARAALARAKALEQESQLNGAR